MRKSIVLVSILLILIPAVVLAGCGGGGESSGNTAEATAKEFFAAYADQDADTSWDLLASESTKTVKKADWEEFLKESPGMEFTVGEVTVNGDKATAEVTAVAGEEKSTETVPLVKEDGAWKVNLAAIETQSSQ
jgi:ABC-type uncharacterized transport system YnjBCD substrate-binding protein